MKCGYNNSIKSYRDYYFYWVLIKTMIQYYYDINNIGSKDMIFRNKLIAIILLLSLVFTSRAFVVFAENDNTMSTEETLSTIEIIERTESTDVTKSTNETENIDETKASEKNENENESLIETETVESFETNETTETSDTESQQKILSLHLKK